MTQAYPAQPNQNKSTLQAAVTPDSRTDRSRLVEMARKTSSSLLGLDEEAGLYHSDSPDNSASAAFLQRKPTK